MLKHKKQRIDEREEKKMLTKKSKGRGIELYMTFHSEIN